jgi:3' terminal RNA ribose 2'-O-methyltransferase Hen1
MLLTITTTHKPATDLGFLLHKHPNRCQTIKLSFGAAHVFYPFANEDKCTAALLLDVDPVGMIRGKRRPRGSLLLDQYVNDRPYVASSFLSVAIAETYGSALQGNCKKRPDLLDTIMPLTARIAVLPCRGGEKLLWRLFEPLGYEVFATGITLDEKFPEWGDSSYFNVELQKNTTVVDLLSHLYVLIPVLDNQKHYYIDDQEVKKLLKHGKGWLSDHPEKEIITRRYLKYRMSLAREALIRLKEDSPDQIEFDDDAHISSEEEVETKIKLKEERLCSVLSALKSSGAKTVVDIGCGEGNLLKLLLKEKQFEKIVGLDVSVRALEIASEKLRLERLPNKQRERIALLHGSLMYRDRRLAGLDAAAVIEVIEHLDPPRLSAFERALFEFAQPKTIVITTPNREYNAAWENVGIDKLRHHDHRFEWTRKEFQNWATGIADRYNYQVRFLGIGQINKNFGSPTQMGIFTKIDN